MLSDGGSLSTIGLRIRLHGGQVAVCLGRMARGTSTPCNFSAAFDTDSPLILISWPVPVMTPAGWLPRTRCCGARRNECAPAVRIATTRCEPVPDHTQDLSCIVVRAYKRSCEHVDPRDQDWQKVYLLRLSCAYSGPANLGGDRYQSDSIGGKGGTRTLDPGIMSAQR
jgi:hypothetical protein